MAVAEAALARRWVGRALAALGEEEGRTLGTMGAQ